MNKKKKSKFRQTRFCFVLISLRSKYTIFLSFEFLIAYILLVNAFSYKQTAVSRLLL